MRVMHFMTPIDEFSCYYFVAVAWDTNIEDDNVGDGVRAIVMQTLADEDGPMIEKCQAYMGETSDLFSLRPLLLQTDGMAIKARRRMDKILKEAAARDSGADPAATAGAEAVAEPAGVNAARQSITRNAGNRFSARMLRACRIVRLTARRGKRAACWPQNAGAGSITRSRLGPSPLLPAHHNKHYVFFEKLRSEELIVVGTKELSPRALSHQKAETFRMG